MSVCMNYTKLLHRSPDALVTVLFVDFVWFRCLCNVVESFAGLKYRKYRNFRSQQDYYLS